MGKQIKLSSLTALIVLFVTIPMTGVGEEQGTTIATDRPGFGDSPSIVPTEKLQLEAGLRVNHEDTQDNLSFPELLVRYGITESLEVRLLPPVIDIQQFQSDNTSTDPTPFGLGAKLGTSLSDTLDVAGIANVTVPIRSEQDPAFTLAGVLSHSPDGPVGLSLYGGVEGTDHSGDPGANIFSSVAASYSITDNLGSFVEFYWIIPENQTQTFFDGGLTYLITDNVQVDLHAGVQLPHEKDTYFVGAGVGWLL